MSARSYALYYRDPETRSFKRVFGPRVHLENGTPIEIRGQRIEWQDGPETAVLEAK